MNSLAPAGFVAIALKPRPVAIYLRGLAVNVARRASRVEISFLLVLTGRPIPCRPVMAIACVVVIVGGLVVLYIGTLFLFVGGHAGSFSSDAGRRAPQRVSRERRRSSGLAASAPAGLAAGRPSPGLPERFAAQAK